MAPFLAGIFRSGRTTPTSARTCCTPDPPTPQSTTTTPSRAPPSAFKRSAPSPAPTVTPSTPRANAASHSSPATIKVRDFASPPPGGSAGAGGSKGSPFSVHPPTTAPPDRPLPPTPDISPSKGHTRSASGASVLSGRSSVNRNVRPSPSLPGLPPTAFTPPKAQQQQRHHRTTSGPSPSPLSMADVRQRSSTMQSTTSIHSSRLEQAPPPSATMPRPPVTPSKTAASKGGSGHLSGLGRILRTPESKRRPAKLTLRTSNLTPPRSPTRVGRQRPQVTQASVVQVKPAALIDAEMPEQVEIIRADGSDDSNHTITGRKPSLRRLESDNAVGINRIAEVPPARPSRPDRPRSASHGDLPLLHAQMEPLPPITMADIAPSQAPSQPSTPARPQLSTVEPLTTPSTPPLTHRRTPSHPQSFSIIPLPWSSSSVRSLSAELGPRFDDLITFTINRLPQTTPRVLRPSVLKTAANEDARLRGELDRLRTKYESITRHRDGLLSTLTHGELAVDPVAMRKTAEGLRRAVARCDRIARQIFICNDQIRQIEVQGEEHVVGALRVALAQAQQQAQEVVRTRAGSLSSTSTTGSEAEEVDEMDEDGTDLEDVHADIRRVSIVLPEGQSGRGVHVREVINGLEGMDHETERMRSVGWSEKDMINRMSVATVISANQLGFPLPPSRDSASSPDHPARENGSNHPDAMEFLLSRSQTPSYNHLDSSPPPHSFATNELDFPQTARSASTPNLTITLNRHSSPTSPTRSQSVYEASTDTGGEILIYPPTHRRSSSLPLLNFLNLPNGMDLPHTPWKDRYECGPAVGTASRGVTSPLRVKMMPSRGGLTGKRGGLEGAGGSGGRGGRIGKSKSLTVKQKRLSDTTRRARRGRESQLVSPESILLSLATAGWWTNEDMNDC